MTNDEALSSACGPTPSFAVPLPAITFRISMRYLMTTRWVSRLAAASALLTLAGCATPGLFKLSKDEFPKSGPKNPVIRVLGLWQPTEGLSGNKQSRGFSAQVLFFCQN